MPPHWCSIRRRTGCGDRITARGSWVARSSRAPLHRRADLQIEFLVSQKGVKQVFRFDDELALTDIEVPVLVRFKLHQADASGAHLFAGPTFAFTTTATYHDEGVSENVKDDMDGTTDVGLTVGGGAPIREGHLDARYTWGLSSLFTDGETGASLKNRTFFPSQPASRSGGGANTVRRYVARGWPRRRRGRSR